jgi:hypothetical protein
MTGSATKQSIIVWPGKAWIASLALAMTVLPQPRKTLI